MLKELWYSGTWGRILANVIVAVSVLVALYLLYIGYRKLIAAYGRGRKKKVTVKYAEVFELKPPFAKGTVQFGFELQEPTEVEFNILDRDYKVVENLFKGTLNSGIHPFLFDSSKYRNNIYYYQYLSEVQNISKKFIIDN
jgi:hypothetical protein